MELQGKLIKVLPLQTGQGRNGEWRRQDFIVELEGGQYTRKVCIRTWGDKVNVGTLVEGSILNVSFDVESREFNDRWYTDLTAWKVEVVGETKTTETGTGEYTPEPPIDTTEPADDLPF